MFIIEYEESQREPGIWREVLRVPGSHTSAMLKLHGHADYRFRVSGVNDVGTGRPSEPSEDYKTPARGGPCLSVHRVLTTLSVGGGVVFIFFFFD